MGARANYSVLGVRLERGRDAAEKAVHCFRVRDESHEMGHGHGRGSCQGRESVRASPATIEEDVAEVSPAVSHHRGGGRGGRCRSGMCGICFSSTVCGLWSSVRTLFFSFFCSCFCYELGVWTRISLFADPDSPQSRDLTFQIWYGHTKCQSAAFKKLRSIHRFGSLSTSAGIDFMMKPYVRHFSR